MLATFCSGMTAAAAGNRMLNASILRQLNNCPHSSLCGPPLIRSPFDNPLRRFEPLTPSPATSTVITGQKNVDNPEGFGLKDLKETTTLQALSALGRQVVGGTVYVRNAIRSTAYMPIVGRSSNAAETAAHSPKTMASSSAIVDEPVPGESGGDAAAGQSAGGDSSDQRREQHHRTQRRVLRISVYSMLGMFGLGAISLFLSYGPEPEHGDQYADKPKMVAVFCRVRDALLSWRTFMRDPIREKLLPDPVKPPWHQPKFTVVMEMRNVLVCPKWEYKKGHYFVKRPALDYFMDVVGYPNFELVIYTSESMMQAAPVVQQLDPKGNHISHALFRECTKTRFIDGTAMKDLSRLNRDLSKVIYIDWDPQAFQLSPENVLRVPKWEGNMEDTALIDLAELLKTIHLTDIDDVRPTLQFYSQFDNPMQEFRRRASQMAHEQKAPGDAVRNQSRWNNFGAFGGRVLGT